MLDVHVLTLDSSRKDWLRECLESIQVAIERCPFAVNLHLVQGIEGHIGIGRDKGYALGDHPFVTYVDDDDYVLPHAFSQMAEALKCAPMAMSTPERIERNGYPLDGRQRHHLIAYRRDQIIDHKPWVCCGDVRQMLAISEHAWVDLETPAYVHRVYESKARLMRRAHQDELAKATSHV